MSRSRHRSDRRALPTVLATVLATLVLAGGAAAGGYLATRTWHPTNAASPGVIAAPGIAAAATVPPTAAPTASPTGPPGTAVSAAPTPAGVASALRGLVGSPALGGRLVAEVTDAGTGAVLYDHAAATPVAPASTAKLLTAAAVLATRGPDYRITTSVLLAAPDTVVLVGGGDPTLTGAPDGQSGAYPDAARLADLAAAVRRAGVRPRVVEVDDSAFAGPTVSAAWAPGDVPSSYASAITALLADGGRSTPGAAVRSATPDMDAGHEFAALLGVPGAAVRPATAPADARELGSVASAPMSELVDQMLQNSDNVIAECLARQVALAQHQPASFTGAAGAVRSVLSGLGADPGAGMVDGSGLAARDRLSATALVAVLGLVAGPDGAPLRGLVTALPVAGFSGTLADRYRSGASAPGAGVVRAKTGTLTAVSTLAGFVHDADGRLLIFAALADQVAPTAADTTAADQALDDVAARLARCGCR